MKNIFQNILTRKPKLNKFDLSHERKMSMNMGKIYPFYLEEIIPGDKFKTNAEIFIRLAPMLAPVMHRINVYTHFFFVPNRLVWNEWEDFITGGEDGTADPVFPTLRIGSATDQFFQQKSLPDYYGVPTAAGTVSDNFTLISALPFRGYNLIYNEYYRDQNLTPKLEVLKTSGFLYGPDVAKYTTLRQRAWEKDYLTSSLPWAQRGGEATIPIGDSAPVVYTGAGAPIFKDITSENPVSTGNAEFLTGSLRAAGDNVTSYMDPNSTLEADLTSATATTINELRKATKLQTWLERNARGGARYIEVIRSHFGVKSSDARLQRPEYLGGGRQPVVISEVLQTSEAGSTPQGEMSGHGVSVGKNNGFNRSFEEHGYIHGFISVIPRSTYQQGLSRTFQKFDKFDFYWPEFAHLGEQEVKSIEAYCDFNDETQQDLTFGYQQRYAEYKYKPSTVAGEFKTSLDYWHMGRKFPSAPALNTSFIECVPDKRIFAVTDPTVDELYVQIFLKVSALRPMPYFSIPEL